MGDVDVGDVGGDVGGGDVDGDVGDGDVDGDAGGDVGGDMGACKSLTCRRTRCWSSAALARDPIADALATQPSCQKSAVRCRRAKQNTHQGNRKKKHTTTSSRQMPQSNKDNQPPQSTRWLSQLDVSAGNGSVSPPLTRAAERQEAHDGIRPRRPLSAGPRIAGRPGHQPAPLESTGAPASPES
ncbi:hypothetical protein CDD81_7066 [Ophiocordyceps australis]|uniref:Uncharacterized protein n=1 Tax=Ophiocordyceps australis TaxID=1399860 RepID=A0A2C5Y4C0_9HYPO|nr:hypothetical protein CDD81_7066 [Ophiocordyceps australis]